MHQEHNIPWNKLASNFKFIRDNPRYTPHATAHFPRNLPNQGQDLNYFTRVLAKTITTFSETEREKYGNTFDAGSSGLLFSDELRDRYPEYLNEKNQRIQTWIARCDKNGRYHPLDSDDLAEVVKILINENEMPTLLMLAHNPQISLSSLRHIGQYEYGFSRVAESALQFYVFFNLFAATATLQSGEYLESTAYVHLIRDLTRVTDFPAQQQPYKDFLGTLWKDPEKPLPGIHHDLPRLQELLKVAFSLLYRYDVVLRECNVDPDWETEIHSCLYRATWHLKGLDRRL